MEALKSASRRSRAQRSAMQCFFQKDLETGLPAGKGITMVKSHFHDKGMVFGYVGAAHTGFVMAIVETRVRGEGRCIPGSASSD